MEQGGQLFDEEVGQFGTRFVPHAYVRNDASDTSKEAAAFVLPRSGTQRARVYEYIKSRGDFGATDEEIETDLEMVATRSCRPRRKELVDAGLVKDSGQRRITTSGVNAIVWISPPIPESNTG